MYMVAIMIFQAGTGSGISKIACCLLLPRRRQYLSYYYCQRPGPGLSQCHGHGDPVVFYFLFIRRIVEKSGPVRARSVAPADAARDQVEDDMPTTKQGYAWDHPEIRHSKQPQVERERERERDDLILNQLSLEMHLDTLASTPSQCWIQ